MYTKEDLFNFEKLIIWGNARKFIAGIYNITDNFPDKEKFGLSSQTQRSSVSVATNLAEGSERYSQKEFTRYIEISYSSLTETLSHAYVAYDRKYISEDKLDTIKEVVKKTSNKLNFLNNSL